jgi:hypothetical protein
MSQLPLVKVAASSVPYFTDTGSVEEVEGLDRSVRVAATTLLLPPSSLECTVIGSYSARLVVSRRQHGPLVKESCLNLDTVGRQEYIWT